MSAIREAVVLPLLFLSVALLGGLDPNAARPWTPPSTFALMLAFLVLGTLTRSGALDPERLLNGSRPILANANGAMVLVSLFAATAQAVHMLTPRAGLPALMVGLVLLIVLVNTFVVVPDRRQVLRSLAVAFGAAFLLKFVVLAALADPDASRTRRILVALFDLATLGTITQDPVSAAAGYLAFVVGIVYLAGVAALPARVDLTPPGLVRMERGLTARP